MVFILQDSPIEQDQESPSRPASGGVCRLYETDSPQLKELKAKANQAYLEYSLFAGTHTPATQALAALSWHRYVRYNTCWG